MFSPFFKGKGLVKEADAEFERKRTTLQLTNMTSSAFTLHIPDDEN